MRYTNIFVFILFSLSFQQRSVEGETDVGIFEDVIENVRQSLRNLSVPHVEFDTKNQEFGRFNGTLDDVVVTDLDKFEVLKLDSTLIPLGVSNMTLKFPNFAVCGKYDLNGTLIFLVGNQPLHIFGKGGMKIKFGEAYSFNKLIIGSKGGKKIVKDFDIGFNITTMDVKMENFMGGGLLEDIFNQYFSKIGPDIYNYYKGTLFEELKKPLAEAITNLLNEMLPSNILKNIKAIRQVNLNKQ